MKDELRKEFIRGELARIVSIGLSSPLEMTGEEPKALRALATDAPVAWQSFINEMAREWERALKDRQRLSVAYARLFLGPFEILAIPYASFYLEPNQRLMGDISTWVAEQYAEAGLKPGTGAREVPDHAALEWEFFYYLTHKYFNTYHLKVSDGGHNERKTILHCRCDFFNTCKHRISAGSTETQRSPKNNCH